MITTSNIQLSSEQEGVAALVDAGNHVLVTGSAGTGKSTLLAYFKERYKDFPVAASTGIAAVNVGGMTLHSWAGLGLGRDAAEIIAFNLLQSRRAACKRILKAERLAIDEVSMISAELFTLTDHVFQLVRKDPRPFGGVQLVMFGDFLQLPPVTPDDVKRRFAFQSSSWTAADVKVAMLTKVFRQADARFSEALNQVRVGNLTPAVLTLLRSRYRKEDPNPTIEPVTVYTHNADVDVMNAMKLGEIPGEIKEFVANDEGDEPFLSTLQKNCLAPETLRLKVGAQVMLLRNIDPARGLANGSLGRVVDLHDISFPLVKFNNGELREIEPFTWTIKSGDEVLASRTQTPLRLAWAITAHKSQGMTLDKIRVHLDKAFEYGQSYVALSRAKTLEGLFIQSTAPQCIRAHPDAVKFYASAGCSL